MESDEAYSYGIQNGPLLAKPKKPKAKSIPVPIPDNFIKVYEMERIIVFPRAGSYKDEYYSWKIAFRAGTLEIRDSADALLFHVPMSCITLVQFSSTPNSSKLNFMLNFKGDRAIKFPNENIGTSSLWVFLIGYKSTSIMSLKEEFLNTKTNDCDYNELKANYLKSSNSISPTNFYGKSTKRHTTFNITPDHLATTTRSRHSRGIQMDYKGMDGDSEPTPIEVFEGVEEAEEQKTAEVLYELISYEDQIVFQPSLHYKFDDGTKMAITNNDFKCLYNGKEQRSIPSLTL
ncbi:unnamed protein product [Ambrosiozyma monospora]|uniref:Unnamed protein product n=1 Tax=Ambrosiozyma monospora TaxID=43982 RepID=A0ACB5T3I6_AMBMO|nr:unnamed protein product [Ambrosiozyma monospora]